MLWKDEYNIGVDIIAYYSFLPADFARVLAAAADIIADEMAGSAA